MIVAKLSSKVTCDSCGARDSVVIAYHGPKRCRELPPGWVAMKNPGKRKDSAMITIACDRCARPSSPRQEAL